MPTKQSRQTLSTAAPCLEIDIQLSHDCHRIAPAIMACSAPHSQETGHFRNRINPANRERIQYSEVLSQRPIATLLLGKNLHIFGMNSFAELLLIKEDGLRRCGDTLRLARRADQAKLRGMISGLDTAGWLTPSLIGAMSIDRCSGRPPLALIARPLPTGRNGPSVSVSISDPDQPFEIPVEILCQLFKLTKAESRLASMLANGQDLHQATVELGITRNTVRSHLSSIFLKTGVSKQSQLVSLVLKSVASLI